MTLIPSDAHNFAHSSVGVPRTGAELAKQASYLQLISLSDEDLLDSLKSGHADSLAVLFDRYHKFVLNIAYKVLHDLGEAEDVMQEVFFELYRRADRFDRDKGSTKTWIGLYAYHRSLNRRQHLNVRKAYETETVSNVHEQCLQYTRTIWGNLTCEECAELIKRGMSVLNEKQRRTLTLVYSEGLLLSEIAEHMKDSYSNIRHYYYRGLKKLRETMLSKRPSES